MGNTLGGIGNWLEDKINPKVRSPIPQKQTFLQKVGQIIGQGASNVRGNVQAIANPQTRATWAKGFTPPSVRAPLPRVNEVRSPVPTPQPTVNIGDAFNRLKTNVGLMTNPKTQGTFMRGFTPRTPQPVRNLFQNVQNIQRFPQVAQVIPQSIEEKAIEIGKRHGTVGKIGGRTVGILERGFTRALTTPFTNKPFLQKATDIVAGVGSTALAAKSIGFSALGPAFSTVGTLITKGRLPTEDELMESYTEAGKFATEFGPIAQVAGPLFGKVLSKYNPKEIKTAIDLVKRLTAKGIEGGGVFGTYGYITSEKEGKGRMNDAVDHAIMGAVFDIGGTLLSIGGKAGLKRIKSIITEVSKMPPAQRKQFLQGGYIDLTGGKKKGVKGIKIGEKERGFVTSVKEASVVTKEVKAKVKGIYTPKAESKLMGEAEALLSEGASIKFNQVKGLDKKITATIQKAINLQRTNPDAAANLYNNLSEHGTELGRGVKAFSMIDKMTPEAISLSVAGKINAYNKTATKQIPKLTGEQVEIIGKQIAKIDKLTGRQKNIAIDELQQLLSNFIPSSLADKAITVWKAGLLTSLRTHERNIIGNTMMATGEVAKDVPAVVFDKLMALRTGQRSMTLTGKGAWKGWKKGVKAAKDIVFTGFDPEDAIGKYDVRRVTWGNNPIEQVLKKYTNVVFRTLGGADKPYWHSAFGRSLYDQAGTKAINVGKQGNKAFIEKLIKKPTTDMLKNATKDANYATFHDKNILSKIAGAVKRAAKDPKLGWGAEAGKVITEVTVPFTGVPSSIVGKTISYSPIGLMRGIKEAGQVVIKNMPELQRQAAQDLGRGVIGTSIFTLGAYLVLKGLITGQPKDMKEADLWKAQGKQRNSIFIKGKWRNINSIGPQNLILLAGAKFQEEMGKGKDKSLSEYGFGVLKDQLDQTFLSGIQRPLAAINEPKRYGKSYIGNLATSVIPNIVKDTSKALDPLAREANTIKDYVKRSIPLVRNTLLPRRDVLGNVIPQEPTGINAFFDLFNSKKPIENNVIKELTRLYDVGNEAMPSRLGVKQTILKQKVELTFEQLNRLEEGLGKAIKPKMEVLMDSPVYKQLDDEKKASIIDKLVQDTRLKYKNVNAIKILSGESATGSPQVKIPDGTTPSFTKKGKAYEYIDEEGDYKTIDLSSIKQPEFTGNEELDKKILSKYKGSFTTRANNILKLYEAEQITQDEAEKLLKEINEAKLNAGIGTGKKKKAPPKITIKKSTAPLMKISPISFKRAKIGRRQFVKQPNLTISKNKSNIKIT